MSSTTRGVYVVAWHWQASVGKTAEDKKMIIHISFGWLHDDGVENGDTEKELLTQDHGDYDITRPVAILKPVADTSSGAEKEIPVDPYDNGYWTKLPLQ
jgi:hypothetical protein